MDYCKRRGSLLRVDYFLSAFKGANQIFTGYPLIIAQYNEQKVILNYLGERNYNFISLSGKNDCKNIPFFLQIIIYFQ